ncbi:PepSY domain-containing protein [Streptomyces sp. NPDC059398]|uniref:PepSY domain-containing protein n=1 Tax=Streptomyces sp. NPDC059398 TaxID=3346820 RepID=UPI003699DD21
MVRNGRTGALTVIAATGALLLCGCSGSGGHAPSHGTAASQSSPSGSPSSSPGAASSPSGHLTEDQSERKALIPAAKVNYEKAAKAAVTAVPGSEPVSVELERGANGKPVWKTEVAKSDGTSSKVPVDATTGKAGQPRTETDEDSEDRAKLAARLKRAKVTMYQAAATATGRKKGTVSTAELDDENGTLVWKIDVVTHTDWNKTTFDVDAGSGKVVREKVDRD